MAIATELPINSGATATQMADAIFGNGVTVNSATYTGDPLSSGIYSDADTITPGVAPSDTGVILSTGYVRDFTNSSGTTNTNVRGNTSTNTSGQNNDADFNALAGASTYDASYLTVNFTPTGNLLTLDFVIASEEYPEWINSAYNDVVGVWVNGVQATVSFGNGNASIGNINGGNATNLYQDNTGDQYNTEMDGFTITLSFQAPVNPGVPNVIKIGVADVADATYDTNLLIAADSVQTSIVAVDDDLNIGLNSSKTIDVLDNDITSAPGGAMWITHINGVAVNPGDSVTLPTGQTVTLNLDGTLTVTSDGDVEDLNFTYSIEDGAGLTDTGLVNVSQMACFTAGTRIRTNRGQVAIEHLEVGDLVETIDGGLQPLRWIGRRTVVATGALAPVVFVAGAYGVKGELRVSPQHRMLIRDAWAEVLFGTDEVLVRAIDLVDGWRVRRDVSGGEVTYFHLLFDQHQIVWANDRASESYFPGPMSKGAFDADCEDELFALFPELAGRDCGAYGPTARLPLKAFEARTYLAADMRMTA